MFYPRKIVLLLIGDVVILYLALLAMILVRYGGISETPFFKEHIFLFSIVFTLWLVVFYIHGLYDLTAAKNTLEFYTALGRAVIVNLVLAIALFYFVPFFEIAPKTNLFITLGFFVFLFAIWRQAINRTLRRYFRQATMIIGPARDAERVYESIETNPQIGYRIALVFTDRRPAVSTDQTIIFTPEDFSKISLLAAKHKINTVIVAEEAYRNARVVSELEKLLGERIEIITLENMEERLQRKIRLDQIDELWFFDHFAADRKIAYETLKRIVDILVAAIILPLSVLTGILIVFSIKLGDRGPIFYAQRRVGRHGQVFVMYKFRTMRSDAEKGGAQWTVENDPRVTRLGRFLRKARLDELPQLINVFKGEMSFVGPRAERPEFHEILKKEIPFYERRYLIKPGLTGWAQINYTYGSSVEDTQVKLAYDLYYLKNRSFIFDLGVILKTIDLVLRGLGR